MKYLYVLFLLYWCSSCTPYLSDYPLETTPETIDTSMLGTWEIFDGRQMESYLTLHATSSKTVIGTYSSSLDQKSGIDKMIMGEGQIKKIHDFPIIEVKLLNGDSKNKYCYFLMDNPQKDSCRLLVLSDIGLQKEFHSSKELTQYFNKQTDSLIYFFAPFATAYRVDEKTLSKLSNPSMTSSVLGEIIYPEQVSKVAKEKETEIKKLKAYFDALVPKEMRVYVEFEEERKLDFWVYGKDTTRLQVWGKSLTDPKVKEGLALLGWGREKLLEIRELLYEANCISIDNLSEHTRVGQARSGLGKYYILSFDHTLSEEELNLYEGSCLYYVVDDHTILEYGGGAVGPNCMPSSK